MQKDKLVDESSFERIYIYIYIYIMYVFFIEGLVMILYSHIPVWTRKSLP